MFRVLCYQPLLYGYWFLFWLRQGVCSGVSGMSAAEILNSTALQKPLAMYPYLKIMTPCSFTKESVTHAHLFFQVPQTQTPSILADRNAFTTVYPSVVWSWSHGHMVTWSHQPDHRLVDKSLMVCRGEIVES